MNATPLTLPYLVRLGAAVLALSFAASASAQSETTPSHVFQAAQDLIAEIEILREEMGIADYPPQAEPQEDRAPVHVYAKSLEVREKISRAQRRLGMPPGEVGQIPVREIVPHDVLGSRAGRDPRDAAHETPARHRERDHVPTPLRRGENPQSMVYQALGDASFLLDGLVGRPITPSDVYGALLHVHDEMELIAARLKVSLELDPPPFEGRKRPNDVAQQVMRATFKTINLETRLGDGRVGDPAAATRPGYPGRRL